MSDAQPKTLSLPNLLTVLRIVAIPVIVILVLPPGGGLLRSLALLIYILAAITDFLDGLLARMMGETSPLGRMLDPIADKLLVGALIIAFAFDHTFSLFDLIPAIAIMLREIFVSGLREFMGTQNVIMPVSMLAKYKTTAQLIALGICMAEPMMPEIRLIADAALWIAAVLTIWTGWNYWQGRLADDDGPSGPGRGRMRILYFAWLRERLNRGEEEVAPPPEIRTISDLLDWLGARDEAAELAFADRAVIKAALDEEIVPLDTELGDAGTLAIFPPMTGG